MEAWTNIIDNASIDVTSGQVALATAPEFHRRSRITFFEPFFTTKGAERELASASTRLV